MADVLRLANIDQSTTIDLLDGTYKLRDYSWPTGSPSVVSDYEPVPFGAAQLLAYDRLAGLGVHTLEGDGERGHHAASSSP